jgi:hypothetical protein
MSDHRAPPDKALPTIEGRARIAGLRAVRMNAERRQATPDTPRRKTHVRLPQDAERRDGLADLRKAAAARRAGTVDTTTQDVTMGVKAGGSSEHPVGCC